MATKKSSEIVEKKTTRKPYKKTLSPRARVVVQKMAENGGDTTPKSKKEILAEAGYSTSVQNKPSKVFSSKSMIEAFTNAGITDDYLTKKILTHLEHHSLQECEFPKDTDPILMKARLEETVPGSRYISYRDTINALGFEIRIAKFSVPNISAQDKALEKALKVKGAYAPEKHDIGDFSLLDLFK